MIGTNPKPDNSNNQEKKLVRRMKIEQRRHDANTKLWIGHISDSVHQLNHLMKMIQKTLIDSSGYK